MKHIWITLIILIIGCQSSSKTNFDSLCQAFVSWYYKFHPVEATRYGMPKHHDKFHLIGITENEEYIADISRFIIELSQIDATKLSSEDRIDYYILYSHLEKMKFIVNEIRPWEWNPMWILEEINQGLFLLSEIQDITMEDRVKSIQGRLQLVPVMLNSSKEIMISYSPLHLVYGNTLINQIIRIIDELPLKLNSDNLTLDEIDISVEFCKKSLMDYKEWLNHKNTQMTLIKFPLNLNLLDQAFPYFIGEKYLPDHVYQLANKKRIPLQNRLFELSLPNYLIHNDEPVWLDRDDTLEVIHWTIDFIRNKPDNQVPVSDLLSHYYESISFLENFIISKDLIPRNINKIIKLDLAPLYIQSGTLGYLVGHHPKKYNSEVLYHIRVNEDAGNLFPLISQEIDLMNAKNIFPGHIIQIANSQKYSSAIRYMFPDPLNEAGWQIYATQMILNEGLRDSNNVYHILTLREELMGICQTIIEGEYYSGNRKRKDALVYLRKEAFLNNSEAENLMKKSDLNYFSGTQDFIGIMEMNSIKKEYIKNKGDNFNIFNFHQEILKLGVIPFVQLKKEILSM